MTSLSSHSQSVLSFLKTEKDFRLKPDIPRSVFSSFTNQSSLLHGLPKSTMSSQKEKTRRVKKLKVYTKMVRNKVVHDSIRSLKWVETHNSMDADVLWVETSTKMNIFTDLVTKSHQKISRYPGMGQAVSKFHFSRAMNRMRTFFPKEYSFSPQTFLYPDDVQYIYDLPKHAVNRKTFIVKPSHGSQGAGIFLTQNIKKTVLKMESKFQNQKYVIQEYIQDPYLVDGLKFDLRIYALIVSLDPLKIYIFNDGLCRFSTEKYVAPTQDNLENTFMHMTNYSLNKYSDSYDDNDHFDRGSKRNFKFLFEQLRKDRHDPEEIWERMKDQIAKTVIAIAPNVQMLYRSIFTKKSDYSQCFQLLGFDILLDKHGNSFMLEVNHHPSLSMGEPIDESIKRPCVVRALKVASFDVLYRKLSKEDREKKRDRYEKMYCQGWSFIKSCESAENKRLGIFSLNPLLDSFIHSCGVRSNREMLASKFYKFARDYGILSNRRVTCGKNRMTRVELDLMFIDAQKRSGLNYLSFNQWLECLLAIAQKLYGQNKQYADEVSEANANLSSFLSLLQNHILTGPQNQRTSSSRSTRSDKYSFYSRKE